MARIELSNIGGGGGTTLSLTTTGTSGAATLAGSVLNIPIYQGALTLTTLGSGAATLSANVLNIPQYQDAISLTTTGTSGASMFAANTLNIPQYQGAITLTTTGTSGAATFSGNVLNIPQYSGGGTPAGNAGEIQFNSTPAGSFAASVNLAWDNTATQLNIGAPSAPTGKLNVKGGGATSSTVNLRLTNSGNTELVKVLDNGSANIGTGFNWDNANGRLGIGITSPSDRLEVNGNIVLNTDNRIGLASTYGPNTHILFENTGSSANGILFRTQNTTNKFKFQTGTNEQFRIDGANNSVSIGTSSGTARLHVRGSNTSSGTNALLIQNSTPSDLYKIENDGKISYLANAISGTTGNQTINAPSGNVNFAAAATTLVVTNSLCTTSSLVFATVRTADATAYIKNVVPAAGSFTIELGAAATGVTSVGFFIIN